MRTTLTPRRRPAPHRRPARAALATAAAASMVLAGGVAAPATASAQGAGSITPTASSTPEMLLPAENRLIVSGTSGLCGGAVSATVSGEGYPDSSRVNWGVGMVGVGACDLGVTLSWHNLDTGDTGEKTIRVDEPKIWSGVPHPKDSIIGTGAGRVEYTLTTTTGQEDGPIEVVTPAYED